MSSIQLNRSSRFGLKAGVQENEALLTGVFEERKLFAENLQTIKDTTLKKKEILET